MENTCNHTKILKSPFDNVSNCGECGVLVLSDKLVWTIFILGLWRKTFEMLLQIRCPSS